MYYCTSPHSNPQTDIYDHGDREQRIDPIDVPREGDWAKDASDQLEVR